MVSLYRVPEGGSFIAWEEAFIEGYFTDHFTIQLKLFHGRISSFCNSWLLHILYAVSSSISGHDEQTLCTLLNKGNQL